MRTNIEPCGARELDPHNVRAITLRAAPAVALPYSPLGIDHRSILSLQRTAGNHAVNGAVQRSRSSQLPRLQLQLSTTGIGAGYSKTLHSPKVAPIPGVVPGFAIEPSWSFEFRATASPESPAQLTLSDQNELSLALEDKATAIAVGVTKERKGMKLAVGATNSSTTTSIEFGKASFTVRCATQFPALTFKLKSGMVVQGTGTLDSAFEFTPDYDYLKSLGIIALKVIAVVLAAVLVALLATEGLVAAALVWLARALFGAARSGLLTI